MNHSTYTYRSIGNSFIMCVTINSTIRSEGKRRTIKSIRMKCNAFHAFELEKTSVYLALMLNATTNHIFIHVHWNLFYISYLLQHISPPATCKVTRKLAHSPTSRRIPWPTNKFGYTRDFIAQIICTMALMQNARGKSYSEHRVMRQRRNYGSHPCNTPC